MAVLVRTVQAFDTFALIPDEYIGDGDTVVVLGHDQGRPLGANDVRARVAPPG
jgi:hypothetical protein